MATMNISLSDDMKSWIENEAADGKYSNTSDFMRDIVRREIVRRATIEDLRRLIDEGLASGVSTRSHDEIFEAAIRQAGSVNPNA